MTPEQFQALVAPVIDLVRDRSLDRNLESELNAAFPPGGGAFKEIFEACREAIAAGWMCNREGGGIRYGRVVKPAPSTHDFSVDVVDMADVVGPHHRHPRGEIDLVMPLSGQARFDGRGAGWVVYGPGSAHRPTVAGGEALVLYLLPGGFIEFTKEA